MSKGTRQTLALLCLFIGSAVFIDLFNASVSSSKPFVDVIYIIYLKDRLI
jgi:hypothetical protein